MNGRGSNEKRVGAVASEGMLTGSVLGRMAFGIGLLSALISAYWAAGGLWLVNTIGGTLERAGRAHDPTLIALLWIAVGLKLVAAYSGLPATSLSNNSRWRRPTRIVSWTAAVILSLYGAIYSGVGWLVQAGIVSGSGPSDQTALRWHAFFWDPWFLIWGLCLAAALCRSRSGGRDNS